MVGYRLGTCSRAAFHFHLTVNESHDVNSGVQAAKPMDDGNHERAGRVAQRTGDETKPQVRN